MDVQKKIRMALAWLENDDEDLRLRVQAAADCLSRTVHHISAWPDEELDKAQQVISRILQAETPIVEWDDSLIKSIADDMYNFCHYFVDRRSRE